MPLRNLFYVSRMYEAIIRKEEIYGSRAVKLPNPHFIVFYNGTEEQPERKSNEAFQSIHKTDRRTGA